jgi:hypothetical protein
MKKLASSFVIILGLSLLGLQSFASEGRTSVKSISFVTENPWDVFKGVVHTYKTSNVEFMYKSDVEQQAFLLAATEIKEILSGNSDIRAEQKIRRIDQAVTVFKYLWDTKDLMHAEQIGEEVVDIPKVI